MDLPKPLLADIKTLQNELKLAIQNHQVIVLKLRADPLNMQIKKQLIDVQKHIILLGDSQKQLIQQLRKELEANSTNSKIVRSQIGNVANNLNSSPKNDPALKEKDVPKVFKDSKVIRRSSLSPSSISGSEESEPQGEDDSLAPHQVIEDSNSTLKLQFMRAVGLVTREVLSELQNRRVERKRRSTANHTQFVYGSSWDVSKRKKNNYLMSGSSPIATRNLTRSLRSEVQQVKAQPKLSSSPASPPPPPTTVRQASVIESVSNETSVVETHTASSEGNKPTQTLAPSLSCASGTYSLRIPGLPASLTIERIAAAQQICVVCRKTGSLSTCNSCSVGYHSSCGGDANKCPQCCTRHEEESDRSSASSPTSAPSSVVILQSYVSDIKEKEAEKQCLIQQSTELNSEKGMLEQKAERLSAALVAQTVTKQDLLQCEEKTRKSIQRIHDFIALMQSAHSLPPPPS